MAIVPNFNFPEIDDFIDTFAAKKQEDIIRVLKFVGEKAVNEARANGSYNDRTANLRNSTGYVIIVDGKVLLENFEGQATGPETTTIDGKSVGKKLAYEIAGKFKDIALVVVAGMNYAAHVESIGKNVLTSAEQLANVQVPLLLDRLK